MTDWRTFEYTVSPEKWARIKYYIEEAEDATEPTDCGLASWYDVASVLSKHEQGHDMRQEYGPLIADYEMFWDSMAGITWP